MSTNITLVIMVASEVLAIVFESNWRMERDYRYYSFKIYNLGVSVSVVGGGFGGLQ